MPPRWTQSTQSRLSLLTVVLLISVWWILSLNLSAQTDPSNISQTPSKVDGIPAPPKHVEPLPLPTIPDPSQPEEPTLPEPPVAPSPPAEPLPVTTATQPLAPAAPTSTAATDRPLIVYAYAESDAARVNLEFFLAKGLHGAADFVFIFNGQTTATTLVPNLPNIRVVERANTCFDLGAIGEVLREGDLWKKYKRFITMNASIRGPFLPMWSSGCWSDLYLRKVTDTNKLVGMTLNCIPRMHIQSMIFATDDIGMGLLLDPALATSASVDDQFGTKDNPVGLSGCYADWNAAVHAEVGTTSLITNAGYTVDAFMTSLRSEATPEEYCRAHPESGDMLWDKRYFGSNIHPYETVFIKANRDVDAKLIESMTAWHLRVKTSGFDSCGRE
ncbi:hypothetical protein B0T22DRAFT_298519 [Podospora appendiculata]|uniref:Uncharacterized protein n=1 Tax=Podospora appendiculata TaxID=314037 RepID=A0AAE0WZQ4_9PEZI|nr:hypothetical protein B0T22DRAFT_298519 [Podospora appendiculata]